MYCTGIYTYTYLPLYMVTKHGLKNVCDSIDLICSEEEGEEDPVPAYETHSSGLFILKEKKKSGRCWNKWWKCTASGCGQSRIITPSLLSHLKDNHTQDMVDKFTSTPGVVRLKKTEVEEKNQAEMAQKQMKLGFTTASSGSQFAFEGYEGTREALLHVIVLFIIVLKMPLRLVDLAIFKALVYTAIAYGRARHNLRYVFVCFTSTRTHQHSAFKSQVVPC